jgi:hypothetical protein
MAGIVLEINVDDKGTVQVKKFSDETKKAFKEMEEGPKKARGSLDSLREGWIGLTAKITIATAAIYAVKKALSSCIDEAAEAEEIENRLRFALETTGYSWDAAKFAVDEFANSIQANTRFSDDQARQALTDMMTYTQDFTKAQMGAKLAMDVSVRTHQDLITSTRYVGMAMGGNAEAMGRYILELRNLDDRLGSNATMAQKSEYAMKLLQEKFGGSSQADIKTYAGIVDQCKNAWSDFKEALGNEFLPVLKEVFLWMTKTINLIKASGEKDLKRQLDLYKQWLQYGIAQGASPEFIAEYQKKIEEIQTRLGLITEEAREKARKKLATQTKKDVLPVPRMSKEEIEKDILEYNKLIAEAQRLSEAGKMPSWEDSFFSYPARAYDDVRMLNLEFAKTIAEAERLSEAGEMPDWRESLEEIPKGFIEIEGHLYELKDIIESYDVEASERVKDWVKNWKTSAEKASMVGETFAQNMASAWNFNVKNIIKDSKNMGDAVENVFTGMADAFTSAVSKMISDWMLFGSITGEYKEGKGAIGALGGIASSILGGFSLGGGGAGSVLSPQSFVAPTGWQEGGSFWVNRPMPIIVGEGGKKEFVNIVPENKMRNSGSQSITLSFQINVGSVDKAKKFGSELRDEIETIVTKKIEEYSR